MVLTVRNQANWLGPISNPKGITSSTGRPARDACSRQASALGASNSQNECLPSAVTWLRIHCIPSLPHSVTTLRPTASSCSEVKGGNVRVTRKRGIGNLPFRGNGLFTAYSDSAPACCQGHPSGGVVVCDLLCVSVGSMCLCGGFASKVGEADG